MLNILRFAFVILTTIAVSCSSMKKADFVNVKDKNFKITNISFVTKYPALMAYCGLDDKEIVKSMFKAIPISDIAKTLSDELKITVDTSALQSIDFNSVNVSSGFLKRTAEVSIKDATKNYIEIEIWGWETILREFRPPHFHYLVFSLVVNSEIGKMSMELRLPGGKPEGFFSSHIYPVNESGNLQTVKNTALMNNLREIKMIPMYIKKHIDEELSK